MDKTINIAIIGAGQLGSRHLQALALTKQQITIQVVDASGDALKIAEARFKEVGSNFTGSISFNSDITSLQKNIDIAIIATNSKVRRLVLEQLVAQSKVKHLILEKFLFTKKADYVAVEKIINDNSIKTYVNCPRRMMDFYNNLQKEIKGTVQFTATGNAWGLACNGIHFVDLFAFLTKSKTIILSDTTIDTTIIESKRPGYIEFTGTITGFAGPHSFQMTSFAENSSPVHIIINTPTVRYSIQEGATAKVWISKLENNWAWEEKTFAMPFQSQLTVQVVNDLLEKGTCNLPTYDESSHLHQTFLNTLISFLQKIKNDNSIDECLIT